LYPGVRAWRLAGAVSAVLVGSSVGATACRETPRAAAPASGLGVVDGDGDSVRLARPARRIVSLVPSATDLVVALGGLPQLVGRTRYDRAPAVAAVSSLGGGLDPDLEQLTALRPDLVLTWAPSRTSPLRHALIATGAAIYATPTRDTGSFYSSVAALGTLLGRDSAASALARAVRDTLAAVHASVAGRPTPTVLYVVWGDPPMTVGPQTFVGELIRVAGGRNAFDDATSDWPVVSMEEVVRRAPDVIVLSVGEDATQGAERLQHAPGWRALPAVRAGHVVALPADLLERPGPALGDAARRLARAIHPEVP
jgi:iron complex transport system substrate-binding protein